MRPAEPTCGLVFVLVGCVSASEGDSGTPDRTSPPEVDTGTILSEPCAVTVDPTYVRLSRDQPLALIRVPACAFPLDVGAPEWLVVELAPDGVILHSGPGARDHAGETVPVPVCGVLADCAEITVDVAPEDA